MKNLSERLQSIEKHVKNEHIKVMIVGLGSVATYLLDYLVSSNDAAIEVIVVGRDYKRMEEKVNIVRVSALIRQKNKTNIKIEANVDLNDSSTIEKVIQKYMPDFIVNTSRAYPGLKYGSISWKNVRAYGIWSPLAISLVKNLMDACEKTDGNAVIINTSYSDVVIPWLKSAGHLYPDFGSGNLNHLIPRMKFAVAEILQVADFWNVDIIFAAGHFHDVCISKEGHTEGIQLPLKVLYKGIECNISHEKIYAACKILMPIDATRNMMNASSNYQIIYAIIMAVRTQQNQRIFVPGAFGNIGGYPVIIGYQEGRLNAWIDTSVFTFDEMQIANKQSMELDGIEKIEDGKLYYTDTLIQRGIETFDVELPKAVAYDEIEKTAQFLINKIIIPQTNK